MKILPLPTFGWETPRRNKYVELDGFYTQDYQTYKQNNNAKFFGYAPIVGGVYAGCHSIASGMRICEKYKGKNVHLYISGVSRIVRGVAEIYCLGPVLAIMDLAKFIIEQIALCFKKPLR